MQLVAIELSAKTPKGQSVWEHHFDIGNFDPEADFLKSWKSVLSRPGESPIETAWRHSRELALKVDDSIMRERSDGYVEFIKLAACLQRLLPAQCILLPVEIVAQVMNLAKATISTYRRWAVEDGLLTEVTGSQAPKGGRPGRATEFQFRMDLLKAA